MSYGIFIDKKHRPSNAEINATLGKTKGLWESLIQSIRDKINVQEDFSFLYGKNYGWGLRFRYKGKLLICFYPNTNYFVTQLILNTQYLSDPIIDTLHSITSKAIKSATSYKEGKWLFITTKTNQEIKDINTILRLKTKIAG